MHKALTPPEPIDIPGTARGGETVLRKGKEPDYA